MISCKHCGLELEDNMAYCPLCNTPVHAGNNSREKGAAMGKGDVYHHLAGQTGEPGIKRWMQNLVARFKRIFHT